MDKVLDLIKTRRSVRTYDAKKVESSKLKALSDIMEENTKGPFGSAIRFKIIHASESTENELKKVVSYGNIKGAAIFIAGTVKTGEKSMEDFGYSMEKNVLMATSMGLGTVWLAGSLNRSNIALGMNASKDEVIPAISPLGYAADKRSIMDKVVRKVSGGDNRKEFGKLFYLSNLSAPLDKSVCSNYYEVLEAVRLAPSASNKQPWRIIKDSDKNVYHFYMDENKAYNNVFKDIKIQNIDMGIAMCHFELAARELGLEGSWLAENPNLEAGELVYIVSWKG
jgi:nitroreductase